MTVLTCPTHAGNFAEFEMLNYQQPDARGHFGPYGGTFVSETLIYALDELKNVYEHYRHDEAFKAEFRRELAHFVGRPSPIYHAARLSSEIGGAVRTAALDGSIEDMLVWHEVRRGDTVKKGQLLATFAGDAVQADVAQAKAALMEAQANALDAAANAERARTLQNTGALSTQQINQYLTAEKTAAFFRRCSVFGFKFDDQRLVLA